MTYEFDVTAGNTPLGTILTTLGDAELREGSHFRVTENAAGAVELVLSADHPKAALVPDDCYVRIRDTALGSYIAGGFPTGATVKLISRAKDRRELHRFGPGALGYLRRAGFRNTNYSTHPAATPDVFTRTPGMVEWFQQTWGAILTRAIEEGRDMPGTPLGAITLTFSRGVQTGGADWTLIDTEGFSTAWGTRFSELLEAFIRQGLHVNMTPALQIQAWETPPGTDHSGAAYAIDVVRFQIGADPEDLLANIMTDAERVWQSERTSHLMVVGGDGATVRHVEDSGAPVKKQDVYHYPESSDPDTLIRAGQAELARRALRAIGSLRLPVKLADDPTNGSYLPGPGRPLWPGNTGTIFTGSEQYDISADMKIAALDFRLTNKHGWTCNAETGTVFIDREGLSQNNAVHQIIRGTTPRPHSHPEILCPPAIDCADLPAGALTAANAANGDVESGASTQWTGGSVQTTTRFEGTNSFGNLTGTEHEIVYTWDLAQVFTKDVRYVAEGWSRSGTDASPDVHKFGVPGVDEAIGVAHLIETATGADGNTWHRFRLCWTPSADRTGVRYSKADMLTASGPSLLDDVRLYTTDNNELGGIRKCAARGDHSHHAHAIPYNNSGSGLAATDMQAAIDELATEGASLVIEEEDGVPTGAFATLKVPNGSLTDNGDDSASLAFPLVGHVHSAGEEGASIDGAYLTRTGSVQNIPDSSAGGGISGNHPIIWTTEEFDTGSYWDPAHPSRINITNPGWYELWAQLRVSGESTFDTSPGKFVLARFFVDGEATVATGEDWRRTISALSHGLLPHGFIYLEAGQYVECVVFQNTGETLTVPSNTDNLNRLFVRRVRDGGSTDPAEDTQAWMPLTTRVAGELVLVADGDDGGLIPTLVPLS